VKWAVDIGLAFLVVWSLLSWASAPNATYNEHTARLAAEQKVVALQTQVATLEPTPVAHRCVPYYPSC
jgi:hypothetical protein